MKLRLRLLTPGLVLVHSTDVTLALQVDVVTFDGRRYLRTDRDGNDEGDGALAFDYVEETTYAVPTSAAYRISSYGGPRL